MNIMSGYVELGCSVCGCDSGVLFVAEHLAGDVPPLLCECCTEEAIEEESEEDEVC